MSQSFICFSRSTAGVQTVMASRAYGAVLLNAAAKRDLRLRFRKRRLRQISAYNVSIAKR